MFAQAAEASGKHLRTRGEQREVDRFVERSDHRVVANEVKLSERADEAVIRQLEWLAAQLVTTASMPSS